MASELKPADLSLSLLQNITKSFSGDLEIDRDGFGVFYKATLQSSAVVVKRLSNECVDEKEFRREVECLMKARHKNIVQLLGYCNETRAVAARHEGKFVFADVQERLLCFEFLPKGTLYNYITDASCGLEWRERYKIIKEIIEGLYYLHQNQIVHADLKPSNVLLDFNMTPKISGFCHSRCFCEGQTSVVIDRKGRIFGYPAPELASGVITYQFDLYGLGVIMELLLTGEKGYQETENVRMPPSQYKYSTLYYCFMFNNA